eukprot:CAMPEP_0194480826 /NCGR_PEP_ID=MMETSP0253-20130528/3503_1 /TAXON_ID=2966 /ORGANISM="Noctiluca scintillans" /LENGTH=157 /DNA_ID=CAMNT_0039320263 /DNA_START=1 /DNA_END=474 /DNA_ORIENTATION=+
MGSNCCCEEKGSAPLSGVKTLNALQPDHTDLDTTTPPTLSIASKLSVQTPDESLDKEDQDVQMTFKLPNGTHQTMSLTRRPVGMRFAGKGHIRVRKVIKGLHADELGVQPGWVVTHIDSEVIEGKPDSEARNILQTRMKVLRIHDEAGAGAAQEELT